MAYYIPPGFDRFVLLDRFGGPGEGEDSDYKRMRRILNEPWSDPLQGRQSPAPRPPSAIATAREHLSQRPELKRPSLLQRIAAGAAGGLGGYLSTRWGVSPELGQRAAEGILYPGHRQKLGEWKERQEALERAAKLEQDEEGIRFRREQHQAQVASHQASEAASRARERLYERQMRQMEMPPKPAPPSNYEGHLVRILNDPQASPEEKTEARKELQQMHARPEKANAAEEHHKFLVKWLMEAGEAKNEIEASRKAAKIILDAERRKGQPPQVSPLQVSTLNYRSEQEQARDLAGEALYLANNDKAEAKNILQRLRRERQIPYRIYQLAFKEIGEPPRDTGAARGVDALRQSLGLPPASGGGGAAGGASAIDPVGIR